MEGPSLGKAAGGAGGGGGEDVPDSGELHEVIIILLLIMILGGVCRAVLSARGESTCLTVSPPMSVVVV